MESELTIVNDIQDLSLDQKDISERWIDDALDMYDQHLIIQSYLDPPCIITKKPKKRFHFTPRLSFCGVSFRKNNVQPKSILKKPTRWSLQPKRKSRLRFDGFISVHSTWSGLEYDRSSDSEAVCNRLTPMIAQEIKQELNHFKLYEMPVNDASKENTHFFI
ncbi:unnamed protein product [Rhizopus stolonifer]